MKKRYVVRLTLEECDQLEGQVKSGVGSSLSTSAHPSVALGG